MRYELESDAGNVFSISPFAPRPFRSLARIQDPVERVDINVPEANSVNSEGCLT